MTFFAIPAQLIRLGKAACLSISLLFAHPLSGTLPAAAGTDGPLKVFLNADLTHTHAVGLSIKMGLQAGLTVGAARYDPPAVELVLRDHRNNLRRTGRMIEEARSDPATLAVVGGMHSPHYFKFGAAFNDNDLVLLLPWSAGGRLTRMATGAENHIFRVSLDDRRAAPFLAEKVIADGCKRIAAFAFDNGWGRSNVEGFAKALVGKDDIEIVKTSFLRRDAGEQTVWAEVEAAKELAPDCVVMVLSVRGSAFLVNALYSWKTPPSVFSHWSILGGDFMRTARRDAVEALDVAVLSTCLLTLTEAHADRIAEALQAANARYPDVTSLEDVPLPMAFAHAYDLGLILSAAAAQAQSAEGWNDNRLARSAALREALEDLNATVHGVLKTYVTPFGPTDPMRQDGHEALGREDLCLSHQAGNGRLAPREGFENL